MGDESDPGHVQLFFQHLFMYPIGSSEFLSLEIPTLVCTCVVATLFWLLLTLLIRKLKQVRPRVVWEFEGQKTTYITVPCNIYQYYVGHSQPNFTAEYLPIILHPGEEPLLEHCDRLQYDSAQWEFPRDRLKLGKLCACFISCVDAVMQYTDIWFIVPFSRKAPGARGIRASNASLSFWHL